MMDLLSRECRLVGRHANRRYPVMQSIAGPPSCAMTGVGDTEDVIVFWRFAIPREIVRNGGGFLTTIAVAVFVLSLACSGSVALHRTGRGLPQQIKTRLGSFITTEPVAAGESDALLLSI